MFILVLLLSACRKPAPSERAASSTTPAWFEDATEKLGVKFKHDSGATGTYFMPESTGSGGALFDFDNDGRIDIYLVQNGGTNSASTNQLFHQQPDGTYRNVSVGSGLDVAGYGMGVAVGDADNDGLPDVLLTEFGRLRFFRNQGGGRFADVTSAAGIESSRWGTAASFFDYDRDGWLDLVVINYGDYTPTIKCHDTRGVQEYCGPQGFQGTASRLFRNRGANLDKAPRFEDVTVVSGLAKKTGPGLGVLCGDFDGDRWPDIFVADDGMPNRLYINRHDGTFVEEAAQRGIAYNGFGSAAGNMGIAYGDVDRDGLGDFFVTHLSWEQHALWKQGPAGFYQDRIAEARLGSLARRGTGFGTVLADFDLDGALDLAFVNGRIKRGDDAGPFLPGLDPFWRPYAQRNQLFVNDGVGRFQDISDANPAFCGHAAVGRGLACGDIDNDGDIDLLLANAGAPAQVLRNVAPPRGHWLMIRAIDPAHGGRDAYGAEVVVRAGTQRWQRLLQPSYSFLVSNDARAHFGLGAAAQFEAIEVIWPDGDEEVFPGGPADRFIVLKKGSGQKRE